MKWKNTLLEICSPTLTFSSKQVHKQQCLKVTQCSMVNWCSDSIVLPSWWVAPFIKVLYVWHQMIFSGTRHWKILHQSWIADADIVHEQNVCCVVLTVSWCLRELSAQKGYIVPCEN